MASPVASGPFAAFGVIVAKPHNCTNQAASTQNPKGIIFAGDTQIKQTNADNSNANHDP